MIEKPNIDPSVEKIYIGKSDAEINIDKKPNIILSTPVFSFSPPNVAYAMAYGGGNQVQGKATDMEVRMQRIEDNQKLIRRGRVVVNVPQFRSQSVISQTSGNNPFVPHNINGISFASGNVPDVVSPSANSNIKFPNNPSLT